MRILFAVLTFSMILVPNMAHAWGATGHRVVASIAWSRLSAQARRDLRAMGPRTRARFSARAEWADEVRGQEAYRWSGPLHYLNVARNDERVGRPTACDAPGPGCVMSAIERFEDELSNPQLSNEARREALYFLLHFVGDIHQPLHCGYADDRGGNDEHLNFLGRPSNLHRVWDDEMIDTRRERWRPMARRLSRAVTPAQIEQWTEDLRPETWAQESLDLIRGGVYPQEKEIDATYVDRFYPSVEQRLTMAGVRLAAVLERSLAKAREG